MVEHCLSQTDIWYKIWAQKLNQKRYLHLVRSKIWQRLLERWAHPFTMFACCVGQSHTHSEDNLCSVNQPIIKQHYYYTLSNHIEAQPKEMAELWWLMRSFRYCHIISTFNGFLLKINILHFLIWLPSPNNDVAQSERLIYDFVCNCLISFLSHMMMMTVCVWL